MTLFEFLACAVLVLVSAFLSSSELALFSLSRFDLRALKERLRPGTHRNIKRLLGDPGGLLITLLFLNEVVNISLTTVITEIIARSSDSGAFWVPLFRGAPEWVVNTIVGTIFTTPVVLIFCEITPKVIGTRANQLIAAMNASSLSVIYDLCKPVRFALEWLVRLVSRRARSVDGDPTPEDGVVKEADFLLMVEEGRKEGAIQQSEFELIKNVFELDDTTVEDVYTPANQVQSVTDATQLKDALGIIRNHDFSRVPIVSSANRRQIIGILYAKDLLRAKIQPELQDMRVTVLMRKPLFVAPTTRLNTLFRKFKQQRTHMAVVQKPNGECLGVVTMKDVLDALFDDLIPGDERMPEKETV